MDVTFTSWERGSYKLVPYPERRPVTRTREQWAELIALWYAVHGSTLIERLRLWLIVWWLGHRRRLQEPCAIRLDPEAFGVFKVYPTSTTINPLTRYVKPPARRLVHSNHGTHEILRPPPLDSGGMVPR